jgi:hypothetical protein
MLKILTIKEVCWITIVLINAVSIAGSQNKLELTASLNKSVYLEGEPIWMTFILKSKSGQSLPFYSDCVPCGDIALALKNSHGKSVQYRGSRSSSVIGKNPMTVSKNFSDILNLLDYFGKSEIVSWCLYLPADSYTLQVNGDEGGILGEPGNKTSLHTNLISFKVVAPQGDEEKIRQLYRQALQALGKHDYDLQESLIMQIFKKYPKSVYLSKVMEHLLTTYAIDKPDKLKYQERVRMFLQRYPEDPINHFYVNRYVGKITDLNKRNAILDSIIRINPNSFQAKTAMRLKEINTYRIKLQQQ